MVLGRSMNLQVTCNEVRWNRQEMKIPKLQYLVGVSEVYKS